MLSHKWTSVATHTHTHNPEVQVNGRRGREEESERLDKPEDREDMSEIVLWTGEDHCAHVLTAAEVACTRPTQDRASQHASIEG